MCICAYRYTFEGVNFLFFYIFQVPRQFFWRGRGCIFLILQQEFDSRSADPNRNMVSDPNPRNPNIFDFVSGLNENSNLELFFVFLGASVFFLFSNIEGFLVIFC